MNKTNDVLLLYKNPDHLSANVDQTMSSFLNV